MVLGQMSVGLAALSSSFLVGHLIRLTVGADFTVVFSFTSQPRGRRSVAAVSAAEGEPQVRADDLCLNPVRRLLPAGCRSAAALLSFVSLAVTCPPACIDLHHVCLPAFLSGG